MRFLFASQNAHKRNELASLLIPHTIIMPHQVHIEFDHEETGDSFWSNAMYKAEHLFALSGQPVIADDSGLVVDALNGAPGIFSARYGYDVYGRQLDSSEKNQLLLEQLATVPPERRTARFVCAMALVLDVNRRFLVEETVSGYIAINPFGIGGFGYDPIFLVEESNRTMATLPDVEKNKISHRGRAARRILTLIHTLEQEETFHVC
jgi:XTP/dITP diphosphohydrolase